MDTDRVDLDTLSFVHPVSMAQLDELARRLRLQLRSTNERVAVEVTATLSDRVQVIAHGNGSIIINRRYQIAGAPCQACADTKRYGQSMWAHTCGGAACPCCGMVYHSGDVACDACEKGEQ